MYEILKEVEKCAEYTGMEKKDYLQLRLLAEELVSMLPGLLEYYEGEFWISNRGKRYALNVSVQIPFSSQEIREHLMVFRLMVFFNFPCFPQSCCPKVKPYFISGITLCIQNLIC